MSLPIPNYSTQSANSWRTNVDGNIALNFGVYPSSTPDMYVKVAAGAVFDGSVTTEKAIQTLGPISAPASNPRIDRILLHPQTGVASILTGSEAASPTAPSITAGYISLAQILLATSTTAITDALITTERPYMHPYAGARAAALKTISGLIPSNSSGDATNDIDFSAGFCGSYGGQYMITAAAAMTKRADATWAAGDGNGGMAQGDSFSSAGTLHFFVLGKSTDPTAYDFGFTFDVDGSGLMSDTAVQAAGFDILQRVFSLRNTSGSAWQIFKATEVAGGGVDVEITPLYQHSKDWTGADDSAQTLTFLNTPSEISVIADYTAYMVDSSISATSGIIFSSFDVSAPTPSTTVASFNCDLVLRSPVDSQCARLKTRTSTSRTVRYQTTGSTVDHFLGINLYGWRDERVIS